MSVFGMGVLQSCFKFALIGVAVAVPSVILAAVDDGAKEAASERVISAHSPSGHGTSKQSNASHGRSVISALPQAGSGNSNPGAAAAGNTIHSFLTAARAVVSSQASPPSTNLTTIAESIQIRFQGFKDLDGAYRLNEDDTISIPGVGRLSIAGMSAADLEKALAQRMMGSTGRQVPVSVEVSSYRHVFVDGAVDKPGSFQWQRGLTVVKAVSMTGGLYRPNAGRGLANSPIAQRGRLDIARIKLGQAVVRQARLTAELDNIALLKAPERLIGIFGRNRADALIVNEQTILDNRRAAMQAQLASLAAQQRAIDAEIERLKILAEGMEGRTKGYNKLLIELRKTHRIGGISNQRLFEVEARLDDLEEKLAGTNVQLVRAQSAKQLLDSRHAELVDKRRESLIEEEIKTQAEIRTFQIEHDVALDIVQAGEGGDAVAGSASSTRADNDAIAQFEIIRRTATGEQRISAKPLELLLPGDTLVVTRISGKPPVQ